MGRWDPDAGGRLKQAAMELYLERGYDHVTTAEIAERAGLKKRSFFRYFGDKREVLFAGAETFQTRVVTAVADTSQDVAPIDAVISALADGGAQLTPYREFARKRRGLIMSSPDLRERELIKMASLTEAIAEALGDRGTDPLQATLTAHAGVAAFTAAYDRWIDEDGTTDLPTLVHRSLNMLRQAILAAWTSTDKPLKHDGAPDTHNREPGSGG